MKAICRAVLLALVLPAGFAAAKPAEPPPFAHESLGIANGCFVESVCCYDDFRDFAGTAAWARVLQWGAQENEETVAGHAVTVFVLDGRVWCWDVNFGFWPLAVPVEAAGDAARVVPPVVARYPGVVPVYPLYRSDTVQPPEARPPEVLYTAEETALRDATLAGARLGAHRPVNVVGFNFTEDGETRRSAAAVFIFGGRLFVYFPERGTIPFIVPRLSIFNLRQLRDGFRRFFTGATALKSLNH